MNSNRTHALAALTVQLPDDAAASEIQLTPAGSFRAADGSGRPADVDAWRIDAAIARKLIVEMKARRNKVVIDYEHQTLLAAQNGKPAPAAGWFKELLWREGQGLFATDVRWTPAATEMLKAGEYRYISPVFAYNRQTGALTSIRMAALTNDPGLDGMASAALSAALANFDLSQKESQMDLKQILAALGLPETTDEAAALTALTALKAKAEESATALAALKATTATADSVKDGYKAAVLELQTQVAALTAAQSDRELDALLAAARAEGKPITDALATVYKKDYAGRPSALKAVLQLTAATAALTGTQTGGKAPSAGAVSASLTAEELAVCKALSVTPEDFLKAKE